MVQRPEPDLALKSIDKVLVTGASGFIGRHLVARLDQLGKQVVCVSRQHGLDISHENLPLQGVGHVFHLAARTGVPDAWRSPLDYLSTNALGTARILEQCRGHCSVTFISAYVYGNPGGAPISETDPVDVQNPYALSKMLAEQICNFYASSYNLQVVILRPFNVYGPGQSPNFIVPIILTQILDPLRPEIHVNDLEPSRDYLYISDMVEAIIVSSRAPRGSIFNVGSGIAYSVEELIQRACAAARIYKPYQAVGEKRRNEIGTTCADIRRLNKIVGWSPKISIDAGLSLVVESLTDRCKQ
jgi:nucleoside-diphosphate-sugar epimerase